MAPPHVKPRVAILGRPNVGKSTLFNRLVGRRLAIVDPTPGVTRDRREGDARLGDLGFTLVDTAGLDEAERGTLEARIQDQTARALDEADLALLLIDARAGVTPLDRHFADRVRKSSKPVVVVANKCEGQAGIGGLMEAFAFGLGEPVAISAEHGEGLADLRDVLLERLGERAVADEQGAAEAERPLQLAIVGRPNVGKSTLVNRLLGDERVLTGPEPGVTRDAIAVEWVWQGRRVRLIDTAGLRKRARVTADIERLSAADARRAIQFAEVAVLVIDAAIGVERQDLAIASQIAEEGRALVIAVNKWDLIDDRRAAMAAIRRRIESSLPQVRGVPIVALSAETGEGVDDLPAAVVQIHEVWSMRVATSPLNRWLEEAVERHPPPVVDGRRVRLRFATQVKARPPTFALFTSRPTELPDSYLRYLVNGLREAFSLPGVPIRIVLRKGANPYAPD
jgi:GTP-binding protein